MPLPGSLLQPSLSDIRDIVEEAGRLAMGFFRPGEKTAARIWSKAGGSPVTEADVAVDTFLKIRLSELMPQAGWLSEETADDARRLDREFVWIVDPIDGTRAYLAGNSDWSVAVGLLRDGKPILGIVHAPAHATLFEAEQGRGARRNGEPIRVSAHGEPEGLKVAGPLSMVERLAETHPGILKMPRVPSLALRIARVAEGAVDLGLISSNARDWDIAAADILLREAGGGLVDPSGRPPVYNRRDPVHGRLLAAARELQVTMIDAITAN